jgi:hypothetical protein
MQSDLTLIALQTLLLADLQKERTVSEGKTAVHTPSAADAAIVVDDVLKIGRFDFSSGKRIDWTLLIFRSFIPCERLRIKKAGTKITVTAHGKIVKALDRRNYFITSIRTHSAADTFFGINLPNECTADDLLFYTEKTDESGQTGGNAVSATRFQY